MARYSNKTRVGNWFEDQLQDAVPTQNILPLRQSEDNLHLPRYQRMSARPTKGVVADYGFREIQSTNKQDFLDPAEFGPKLRADKLQLAAKHGDMDRQLAVNEENVDMVKQRPGFRVPTPPEKERKKSYWDTTYRSAFGEKGQEPEPSKPEDMKPAGERSDAAIQGIQPKPAPRKVLLSQTLAEHDKWDGIQIWARE